MTLRTATQSGQGLYLNGGPFIFPSFSSRSPRSQNFPCDPLVIIADNEESERHAGNDADIVEEITNPSNPYLELGLPW